MLDLDKILDSTTMSRTPFELRHFVVHRHVHPMAQYRQIVTELTQATHAIRSCEIGKRKRTLKRAKFVNDMNMDAAEKSCEIEQLDLDEQMEGRALNGKLREVAVLTDWAQVACGWGHTAAVKTDGTLWTFGANGGGQLGVGSSLDKSSPVQVGVLTNWARVSCGAETTIAVKTDGTLWTFGRGIFGQLGDGSTVTKSLPVQVGILTNWAQVAGGAEHTAAIKV